MVQVLLLHDFYEFIQGIHDKGELIIRAYRLHLNFQFLVQGPLEQLTGVPQARVPLVLDGVVAAADENVLEFGPVVLSRILQYEQQ